MKNMLTSWMSLENWHICWYGSATHQIQASSMPKVLFLSLSLYLCVYSNVYAVLFLLHCRLSLSGVHCFSFTHSLVCSFVHLFHGGSWQNEDRNSHHRIHVCIWMCVSRFIRKSVPKWHFVYSLGVGCKCVERICLNKREMRSCLRRMESRKEKSERKREKRGKKLTTTTKLHETLAYNNSKKFMQQMYAVVYKVFDLCGNEHTNKMQNEWRRSVHRKATIFFPSIPPIHFCISLPFSLPMTFISSIVYVCAWVIFKVMWCVPFSVFVSFRLLFLSVSFACHFSVRFLYPERIFPPHFSVQVVCMCALKRFSFFSFNLSVYFTCDFILFVFFFFCYIWNIIVVDLSEWHRNAWNICDKCK